MIQRKTEKDHGSNECDKKTAVLLKALNGG